MLREVEDYCLHFLVECSEERRAMYLFEELNLFIIPSFKSYKWAVDVTFGCTVYQKEGEGILTKACTQFLLKWNANYQFQYCTVTFYVFVIAFKELSLLWKTQPSASFAGIWDGISVLRWQTCFVCIAFLYCCIADWGEDQISKNILIQTSCFVAL